jgi:hypothetical protein
MPDFTHEFGSLAFGSENETKELLFRLCGNEVSVLLCSLIISGAIGDPICLTTGVF